MKQIIGLLVLMLMVIPASVLAQTVDITNELISEVRCIYDDEGSSNYPRCMPPLLPMLDVVFVIDSTGSMQDEIRQVKTHITKIIKKVRSGQPSPDVRVGIITYRDHAPEEYEYVTQYVGITHDVEEALDFLSDIEAAGGGDHPEAVGDGMFDAIHNMEWREYAEKIVFLIGDAAPHGVGSSDVSFPQGNPLGHHYERLAKDAHEMGIRFYTVSGSGIDTHGIRVWKEIADLTNGSYFALSYTRVDVDQYYKTEGLPEEFAIEAKADRDYDAKTNTILVNPFASFGASKMMEAAESVGVSYEGVEDDLLDESESDWGDVILVTGAATSVPSRPVSSTRFDLLDIFESVFEKIAFWR